MGNNELRRKETVESQYEKENRSKSQDSSSKSYVEKMKEYIGPTYAGAWKAAEATMKGATAVFAVQSGFGIGRVEGFSAPSSGTELQVRGDFNLSKVPEYFVQQEQISQAEKQMQVLRDVAAKAKENPEFARKLLEHFGKFMKNPEKFFQTLEPQEQKRAQRQDRRQQLAENTQEALEDLRTLFEEVPEKVKNRKIDIGTERLTPEKINPEVWDNVHRMLTERRVLNSNTATPIVFVHGITDFGPWANGSGGYADCNGGYWGNAIKYLSAQGYSDFRTIQFYTGDTKCDVNLHNTAYQSLCDNFSPGSEGTNNEDLNHVSCLLAQYLNQNFAGGQNVILVGHSLGGIIIRNTMYLVETRGGQQGMPSDIGYVTDAVTFNTPHEGVTGADSFAACRGCTQTAQITQGSDFMNNLEQNAQNPQTPAGFTQWTVVGSECDIVVNAPDNAAGASGAIAMQASHAVMYSQLDSATCYDHSQALHDSKHPNEATLFYCDTSDPVNSPCGLTYEQYMGTLAAPGWVKTKTGPDGLQVLNNAVGQ